MRQAWIVGSSVLLALALAGCPGRGTDEQAAGGGGGEPGYDNPKETHDDSNPVSREQSNRALPLRDVPNTEKNLQGGPLPPNGSVSDARSQQVASNGRATAKVNVNTASLDQLMQVPGVSYTFARAIVQYRPFKDKQDMANKMPNVSVAYLNAFDSYFTFSGSQPAEP